MKCRCKGCGAHFPKAELLSAPNPFDPSETIRGCPRCKQCDEGFALLCDEPGCTRDAGCGWPTQDPGDQHGGYRHTCAAHWVQGVRA